MKRPLVVVEWSDAASHDDWDDVDEYEEAWLALKPIVSVGWLYRDDDKAVGIVQNVSVSDGDLAGSITIPRGMIRKVHVVRGHHLEVSNV